MTGPGEPTANAELVRRLAAELGIAVSSERLESLAMEHQQHLRRADRLRGLVQAEDEPGFLDLRV